MKKHDTLAHGQLCFQVEGMRLPDPYDAAACEARRQQGLPSTREEIARAYGWSPAIVRSLERSALAKLRVALLGSSERGRAANGSRQS